MSKVKTLLLLSLLISAPLSAQSELLLLSKRNTYHLIGTPGTLGFGVGTISRSDLPSTLTTLAGSYDKSSDNYGNYMVIVDSSIMCYIPIFYYKITNVTAAPYYGNKIEIKGYDYYGLDTARAAADGYAVHRAFIDGGKLYKGFFIDKYGWSLTNVTWSGSTQLTGIASSRKNGNPISSAVTTKRIINGTNDTYAGSFSNCISNAQTPYEYYNGAWSVAKSRGNNFACMSVYIHSALAMLSMAHQQAASGITYCAWNSVLPYAPKGNNRSSVLDDYNDNNVDWTNPTDGYWNGRLLAGQTGSANPFNKSTHNGQNSGVADLNGNQWQIMQGITATAVTVNISNAIHSGGVVTITTSSAHGLWDGQKVMILSVVGMTDLNSKIYTATVTNSTTFSVVLTTAQTYTSGGTAARGVFYGFKESVAVKNILQGNTTSAHHYGSAALAANFDTLAMVLPNGSFAQRFGNSTNQVLSGQTSRINNAYKLAAMGFPMAENSTNTSGTNSFGTDYYYQYILNEVCAIAGGDWDNSTTAGVWAVNLSLNRTNTSNYVSGRSCLYE